MFQIGCMIENYFTEFLFALYLCCWCSYIIFRHHQLDTCYFWVIIIRNWKKLCIPPLTNLLFISRRCQLNSIDPNFRNWTIKFYQTESNYRCLVTEPDRRRPCRTKEIFLSPDKQIALPDKWTTQLDKWTCCHELTHARSTKSTKFARKRAE